MNNSTELWRKINEPTAQKRPHAEFWDMVEASNRQAERQQKEIERIEAIRKKYGAKSLHE